VSRIRDAFARAKAEGRAAFIPYITVGHPDRDTAAAVVPALIEAGADIVELGIPFSDPLADGVVIQRSTQIALTNGVTLDICLKTARDLRRAGITAPFVFLGYANPIIQKGEEAFAAACADAGVDGVIVADLPPEEAGDLRAACDRHGVAVIAMLAPTSTEKRIAQVAELATGFVYCVGLTGITGARDALASDLGPYLGRVRAKASLGQDVCQWYAAPLGCADGLHEPWLADGPRPQQRPTIAGALHRDRERPRRTRSQVAEREPLRAIDVAVDGQ